MATKDTEIPNPKTPSSDYKAMAPFWKMVGAILHGVEAMRAVAGQYGVGSVAGPVVPYANLSQLNSPRRGRNGAQSQFLPQLPNESNEDYEYRRINAPLTNIYADISRNLASKPFSKTLELDESSDQRLLDLQEDIDGEGNNLHVFAAQTFKNGIDKAIDWIFIDYDNVGRPVTLAEERASGVRPYWIHIPAERMLAVYSDFVAGEEVFVHARIYEPSVVRDEYSEKNVERVRIYDRVAITGAEGNPTGAYASPTWALWELSYTKDAKTNKDKEAWTKIDEGEITIGRIPLVPFVTGKREGSTWCIQPPLKDLVHMQIEEFQQESNLKSIKEAAAFPMLAGNGVAPPQKEGVEIQVPVGPKVVLFAPPQPGGGAGGSWSYVEPSATSLTFLAQDLEKLRTEMRDLGMQPLTAANMTVITTANLSSKAHTAVQAWALGLEDALELAWWYTAQWLSMGDGIEVEVHVYTDFGVELEPGAELNALLSAEGAGIISKRTVQDEFKRRGVLSDEFDPDEEEKQLAAQQADLMPELAIDPVTGRPLHPEPFKPGAPPVSIADRAAATAAMAKASTPAAKPN